jgi:hypothetical protein
LKNKQPANPVRITSSPERPCCTRDRLGHAPRSTLESVTLLSGLHYCCSTNIYVLSQCRLQGTCRSRSSHTRTLAFPVTSPANPVVTENTTSYEDLMNAWVQLSKPGGPDMGLTCIRVHVMDAWLSRRSGCEIWACIRCHF